MMLRRSLFLALSAAVGIWLVACSQPSVPSSKAVRSASDASLVAKIHAAGSKDDSVIHVEPLRKPGVKSLLGRVRAQEAAHDYKAAVATMDKALELSPEAPDLLQDRAELAVRLGDYAKAEQLARKSYTLGPKLGGLCARNWQTVLEMRRIAKDPASVRSARKMLDNCVRKGPVRM